jgi:hypothetical protein
MLRDVAERHPDSALICIEHFCKPPTFAVQDDGCVRQLEALEPRYP